MKSVRLYCDDTGESYFKDIGGVGGAKFTGNSQVISQEDALTAVVQLD
jgi:hypothetical protein